MSNHERWKEKRRERDKAKRRFKAMLRGRRVPKCAYCGKGVYFPTVDHVLPLSRGGASEPENLVICCSECNRAKADRDLIEWAADILAASEKTIAAICQPVTVR